MSRMPPVHLNPTKFQCNPKDVPSHPVHQLISVIISANPFPEASSIMSTESTTQKSAEKRKQPEAEVAEPSSAVEPKQKKQKKAKQPQAQAEGESETVKESKAEKKARKAAKKAVSEVGLCVSAF
jgi:hypothetical protein